MCGGSVGKVLKKTAKVAKKVADVTTGGIATDMLGQLLGKDEQGASAASIAKPVDSVVDQQVKAEATVKEAEDKAAGLAKEKSLKRRKAIAKGGRASTILAGKVTSAADKKDKLGG